MATEATIVSFADIKRKSARDGVRSSNAASNRKNAHPSMRRAEAAQEKNVRFSVRSNENSRTRKNANSSVKKPKLIDKSDSNANVEFEFENEDRIDFAALGAARRIGLDPRLMKEMRRKDANVGSSEERTGASRTKASREKTARAASNGAGRHKVTHTTAQNEARSQAIHTMQQDVAHIQTTRATSNAVPPSRTTQAPRKAIYTAQDIEDEETTDEACNQKRGSFQELSAKYADKKRARAKERAGKQFSAQFGKENNSASSEGAPRAAVYKAEMGNNHRKAAKMESKTHANFARGAKASSAKKQGNAGFNSSGFNEFESAAHTGSRVRFTGVRPFEKTSKATSKHVISSKLTRFVLFVACAVALCVFIYPAAQQYYVELRNNAKLDAQYEAIQERNNTLNQELNTLLSDDGIRQEARDNYGWVEDGENGVTVYGLQDTTAAQNSVLYGSVEEQEAPETWYSVLLDPFFGVE